MARLPRPHGDKNSWGDILNEYLRVEHNEDGTLKRGSQIDAAYTKPVGGIPKSDLASDVQYALEAVAHTSSSNSNTSQKLLPAKASGVSFAPVIGISATNVQSAIEEVAKKIPSSTSSEGVADHGALTGLDDDDHHQYALADGTRGNFAPLSHTHSGRDLIISGANNGDFLRYSAGNTGFHMSCTPLKWNGTDYNESNGIDNGITIVSTNNSTSSVNADDSFIDTSGSSNVHVALVDATNAGGGHATWYLEYGLLTNNSATEDLAGLQSLLNYITPGGYVVQNFKANILTANGATSSFTFTGLTGFTNGPQNVSVISGYSPLSINYMSTATWEATALPPTYSLTNDDVTRLQSITDDDVTRLQSITDDDVTLLHNINETATFSASGVLAVTLGTHFWYANRDYTILGVRAAVGTAPLGSSLIVDINKNGTTIFTTQSNRPTIAMSANASTLAEPDVTSLSLGNYLQVDIDQVGNSAPGEDLTVQILLKQV